MTTTLAPADGIRQHPRESSHSSEPTAEIVSCGPGRFRWRVFDRGGDLMVQHYFPFAAGHVHFPVQCTKKEAEDALRRAESESSDALAEVRRLLRRRGMQ